MADNENSEHIHVQGPRAITIIGACLGCDLAELINFHKNVVKRSAHEIVDLLMSTQAFIIARCISDPAKLEETIGAAERDLGDRIRKEYPAAAMEKIEKAKATHPGGTA